MLLWSHFPLQISCYPSASVTAQARASSEHFWQRRAHTIVGLSVVKREPNEWEWKHTVILINCAFVCLHFSLAPIITMEGARWKTVSSAVTPHPGRPRLVPQSSWFNFKLNLFWILSLYLFCFNSFHLNPSDSQKAFYLTETVVCSCQKIVRLLTS